MYPASIQPAITLIIPAFNEEELIGSSLDELHSQLSKPKLQAEINIVDDGSTDQTADDFGFDVEVLYLARRLHYKIQPVPVKFEFSRPDSRVRLLKDSLRMFFDLLRIRSNAYQGKYSIE